jgi:hypothetical protein
MRTSTKSIFFRCLCLLIFSIGVSLSLIGQDISGQNTVPTRNSADFRLRSACDEPNPFAALSCELVTDTFCNLSILNGFCSRMPDTLFQPAPTPLCAGSNSMPNNMSWFAFVAGDGDYTITVDPFDCVPGAIPPNLGVQIGIYEDCSFQNAVVCSAPCSVDSVKIPSTALIPVNTYYLFIDGCGGSVCSYNVNVSNFAEFIIPEPAEIVCNSGTCSPICPSNMITLQAVASAPKTYAGAVLQFSWRVTDPTGMVSISTTTGDMLQDYLLDKIGNWKFEILEVRNKCNVTSTIQEFNVLVRLPADEDFGTVALCENFISGWAGPFQDASGNPDPNGDGFAGWQLQPFSFVGAPPPGAINTAAYPGTGAGQEGCVYKQSVNVIELNLTQGSNIDLFLCEDQFPYSIFGVDTSLIISGPVANLMHIVGKGMNGCDSMVMINALSPMIDGGQMIQERLPNFVTEVTLSDLTINQSIGTYQYTWVDSIGRILKTGVDTSLSYSVANYRGQLCLIIEIFKDQDTCSQTFCTYVDYLSGLEVSEGKETFTVYPNPGNQHDVTIDLASASLLGCAMSMFNLAGQNVISQRLEYLQTKVDVSTLIPDIYIIEIVDKNGAPARQKWVKL